MTSAYKKFPGNVLRKRLAETWGNSCVLCGDVLDENDVGDRAPTIEHLVPQSQDGSNGFDNLALAHHRCNNARGDRSLIVWMLKLERKSKRKKAHDARGTCP